MELMVKRIGKQSALIILPLAALSLLFAKGNWQFPSNVVLGGAISLLSFRVIVWAVRRFMGKPMGHPIIIGLSAVKILVIFMVLATLATFKLVNPVGLTVGFTVVLGIIVKEGLVAARKEQR